MLKVRRSKFIAIMMSLLFILTIIGNINVSDVQAATAKGYNKKLEDGIYYIEWSGEDYLDKLVKKDAKTGKALASAIVNYSSDSYTKQLLKQSVSGIKDDGFACRSVTFKTGVGYLYGRNYDWPDTKTMGVVYSKPKGKYKSIATVDLSRLGADGMNESKIKKCSRQDLGRYVSYACVDGMNEKGLYVSILMVHGGGPIDQNTSKHDITIALLLRMILNDCKNVTEAKDITMKYDVHNAANCHLAVADKNGGSIVIEWKNNKTVFTNTKVVGNYYASESNNANTSELFKFSKSKSKFYVNDVQKGMRNVGGDPWTVIYSTDKKKAIYYFRKSKVTSGYHFTMD